MVAVLVSMVFIGIVTSSMIKNAASQGVAAAGYGSMQVMHSTVESGGIATESYFLNTANSNEMLEKVNNASHTNKPFIYGTQTGKIPIAAGQQYFRSRLVDFNPSTYNSQIEINGGRSAGGKDMKKVLMFAYLGNLKPDAVLNYGAQNAIYMKNGMNGDNGLEDVTGNITIMGDLRLQNVNSILRGSVYVSGELYVPGARSIQFDSTVHIAGYTEIDGKATFNKDAYFGGSIKAIGSGAGKEKEFHGKVHVNGSAQNEFTESIFKKDAFFVGNVKTNGSGVEFQSGAKAHFGGKLEISNPGNTNRVVFKDDISIAGDLDYGNHFKTSGNIYLGGSLTSNSVNFNLASDNANKTFFYTSSNTASLDKVMNFTKTSVANITPAVTPPAVLPLTAEQIAARQQDPRIDRAKMQALEASHAYRLSDLTNAEGPYGNLGIIDQITVAQLKNIRDTVNKKPLFNGTHLVIKVDKNLSIKDGGNFGNVIFIVDDGGMLSGSKFYSSMNGTSTLIYIGQNGTLSQFGADGPFNGLIYIDSLNQQNNSFNWSGTTANAKSINGAIHNISNIVFMWNTGSSVPITFMPQYIDPFAALTVGSISGGGGGGGTTSGHNLVFSDSTNVGTFIDIKPFGYYFY